MLFCCSCVLKAVKNNKLYIKPTNQQTNCPQQHTTKKPLQATQAYKPPRTCTSTNASPHTRLPLEAMPKQRIVVSPHLTTACLHPREKASSAAAMIALSLTFTRFSGRYIFAALNCYEHVLANVRQPALAASQPCRLPTGAASVASFVVVHAKQPRLQRL